MFIRHGLVGLLGVGLMVVSKPAQANETQFQSDSEQVVEETIEQKDGKTVRKVRSGKVREREGDAKVGDIESGEVNKYQNRHKALTLSSFGFGPFTSWNTGEGHLLYGLSLGRVWEVNAHWDLRFDLFTAFNSDGAYFSGGFGPSYLFMDGDISPFAGGLIGMGYANGDDHSSGGFSGQVHVGARMFRLSDKQMEVLLSYAGVFSDVSLSVTGLQLRLLY